MKLFAVVVAVALVLLGGHADAKRLGGGGSVGKQSANVTRSAPNAPAAPAPGNTATAAQPAPGALPAAAPARRPWAGILGGVAAGLGLAWLAQSLGMGEVFGQVLLVLLAVMGLALLWRVFKARRSPLPGNQQAFAFQGVAAMPGVVPKQAYRPENVGNDASARPFERSGFAAPTGSTQTWAVPEGFDTQGFLAAAKANFVSLQAAWDRSDFASLRAMMTDAMLAEIKAQLAEREAHATTVANQTDVVMIEARLLGIEDQPKEYMASVEFSGMIREDPYAGPSPFREVWNLTKPKTAGGGWLVAGVQALQ